MPPPLALALPLSPAEVRRLRAGQRASLSGEVLTARDAAHARLYELLRRGEPLPLSLAGACIYYVGPTPAAPGRPIGAAGPTTAARVDRYTPLLMANGLLATIGKGRRSPEVKEAIRRFGGVYFAATGGAGALLSQRIVASRVVAWEELGPEAIYALTLRDFPVVVAIDSEGNDLYEIGPRQWAG